MEEQLQSISNVPNLYQNHWSEPTLFPLDIYLLSFCPLSFKILWSYFAVFLLVHMCCHLNCMELPKLSRFCLISLIKISDLTVPCSLHMQACCCLSSGCSCMRARTSWRAALCVHLAAETPWSLSPLLSSPPQRSSSRYGCTLRLRFPWELQSDNCKLTNMCLRVCMCGRLSSGCIFAFRLPMNGIQQEILCRKGNTTILSSTLYLYFVGLGFDARL